MTKREEYRQIIKRVIDSQVLPGLPISFAEDVEIRNKLRFHFTVSMDEPPTGYGYRIWLDEISKQMAGRVRGKAVSRRPRPDPGPDPGPDPRQMAMFAEVSRG